MPFQEQVSTNQTWPSHQKEHDLLARWIERYPDMGQLYRLEYRVVSSEFNVALYLVQGLGRGDGWRFALVQSPHIVWFEVLWVPTQPNSTGIRFRVYEVEIPEQIDSEREVARFV